MNAADSCEPKREQWQRQWKSFSPSLREKRFADALERQEAVLELKTRDACESERSATEKSRCEAARSSVRRWLKQYEKWGFDGLLDWRCPPSSSRTDLFSQSSKVSSVGRVMPSLKTVSFHSGYGVPLWMVTHSGRMPLANAIPPMLEQFSEFNEGAEIGRIVVIDAEGNSVPFLKGDWSWFVVRRWVARGHWRQGWRIAAIRGEDRVHGQSGQRTAGVRSENGA